MSRTLTQPPGGLFHYLPGGFRSHTAGHLVTPELTPDLTPGPTPGPTQENDDGPQRALRAVGGRDGVGSPGGVGGQSSDCTPARSWRAITIRCTWLVPS